MAQTKGFCKFCGKEYTKAGMVKHLQTCKKRGEITSKAMKPRFDGGGFTLVINAKYNSDYWLIIDMKETAQLKDLDRFLRDIWLECCGHLSSFTIGDTIYDVNPSGYDDCWGKKPKSMVIQLKKVLRVGMQFEYEYDFGSTTTLLIKVAGYCDNYTEKDKITLLSRNHFEKHMCNDCGEKEAEWFSAENMYYGSGERAYLCQTCFDRLTGEMTEEEDEEVELDWEEMDEDEEAEPDWDEIDEYEAGMYLPVCNSPRMGVCGYEGSSKYPEQFLPDENL